MTAEQHKAARLSNSFWTQTASDDSAFPPPAALAWTNLGVLVLEQAQEMAQKTFALWRDPADAQWLTMNWGEALAKTLRLHRFMLTEGGRLQPGDKVLIFSATRWEAVLADYAAVCAGAAVVHVPADSAPDEAREIMRQSRPRIVCLESKTQEESLFGHASAAELGIHSLIYFAREDHDVVSVPFKRWLAEDIIERGAAADVQPAAEHAARIEGSSIDAYAWNAAGRSLIPQAHAAHISMIDSLLLSAILAEGENIFIDLPLSSSFARACVYATAATGGSLIFPTHASAGRAAGSRRDAPLAQLLKDLRQSHPAVLLTTAERLEWFAHIFSSPRRRLARWALNRKAASVLKDKRSATPRLLDGLAKAVLDNIRASAFGGRIKHCLAELPPVLSPAADSFFRTIGAAVYQGLPCARAGGAVSWNTPMWHKQGSAGRLFSELEARTDPSGRLLLRRTGPAKEAAEWLLDLSSDFSPHIDGEGYLHIQ